MYPNLEMDTRVGVENIPCSQKPDMMCVHPVYMYLSRHEGAYTCISSQDQSRQAEQDSYHGDNLLENFCRPRRSSWMVAFARIIYQVIRSATRKAMIEQ